MSYFVTGSALTTEKTILTSSSPTKVLDLGKAVLVASVTCTEVGGATPNLTIEAYNGTTSTYRTYQRPMTAKERYADTEPFQLDNNESLRVTSSNASGLIHVWVNYFTADATQRMM